MLRSNVTELKRSDAFNRFPLVKHNHKPMFGNVLLQLEAVEDKVGSIILPNAVKEDNEFLMHTAKIVAVGDLAFKDKETGERWKCEAPKVGDIVRIPIHGGDRFKIDGTIFVLFKDAHINATVEL